MEPYKILHVLGKRPEMTGSGIYLEALITESEKRGFSTYKIAGVPADCVPREADDTVSNSAPVGYVILDKSVFIRKSNQTLADILGVDVGHLQGRPISHFFPESSKRTLLSQYKAIFKSPEKKSIDVEICGSKSTRRQSPQ